MEPENKKPKFNIGDEVFYISLFSEYDECGLGCGSLSIPEDYRPCVHKIKINGIQAAARTDCSLSLLDLREDSEIWEVIQSYKEHDENYTHESFFTNPYFVYSDENEYSYHERIIFNSEEAAISSFLENMLILYANEMACVKSSYEREMKHNIAQAEKIKKLLSVKKEAR